MRKLIIASAIFYLSLSPVWAQVPASWTVDPNAYTNSMNVTCVLNQRCVELKNANNVVAAFVAGQCRGVAKSTVEVDGRWLAYLTLYSNTAGETVTLKVYNAETNAIFQSFSTIAFHTNGLGGVISPLVIAENYAPTDIALSAYAFPEDISTGTVIAELRATDNDTPNVFSFSLPVDELDNAKYEVVGDQLLSKAIYDSRGDASDVIRVVVTDAKGCSYTEDITLTIGGVNKAPTDLNFSFTSLNDQDAAGKFIGTLTSTDAGEHHTYTMGSCSPNADNAAVIIRSDSVFTTGITLHDVTPVLTVCIRTTDPEGLYFEKSFQIPVMDSHDPEDISLDNLSVKEGNTPDFLVGKMTTVDGDAGDHFTYELVPGDGDEDNAQVYVKDDALYIANTTHYEVKSTYYFRIRSTDGKGTFVEKAFTLVVEEVRGVAKPLPSVNYISPNNDGRNDYWAVQNVAIYQDFSLRILDQFGNVIYSKSDHYNNEWDGKLNGRPLPDGNYYFIFTNGKKVYKGNIAIVNQ